MRKRFQLLLAGLCAGWLAAAPASGADPTTAANAEDAVTAVYNAALKEFNGGNWAGAAETLEKVVALVTDPVAKTKIGPVYYTLGAAYFNAKNYPKAITTFTTYLTQFPQAEHVPDAKLAMARSLFLSEEYEKAAQAFLAVETIPAFTQTALAAEAECYRLLNKPEDQIRVIEKLILPEVKTSAQATSAVTLAELYLAKHETEKVLALVNTLFARIKLVGNVVSLNVVTLKLGDELAANKSYAQALAAYRAVLTREQVIAFQNDRIAAMERKMQANLEGARGNAQAYLSAAGANHELELQEANAKTLLEEFTKLPDYWPGVLFRNAQVWYEWDKKWEAIVAFRRLLDEHPEAPEAEAALYSTVVCYAELGRSQRTLQASDEYAAKFPQGEHGGTIGYMKGAAALQNNDSKSAITFFGITLEQQPKGEFSEQMRFLLGNAHFSQGEYDAARKQYDLYQKDYPQGGYFEEAVYRSALSLLFQGKYEEALKALQGYLEKYKTGTFIADGEYRVMVCKYAASLFDEVIADATAWQKAHPEDQIAGEVYALLGDALAAKSRTAEAAEAYTQSERVATTDEVLNYALFEASKQLQKLGKWPEVAAMFEEFVKARPDHPTVVAAMFWIGKAKVHEGQSEEAKQFLVENLKRYIAEPKREAVEQLLQQLAQLCAKRPRPKIVAPEPAPALAATEAKGAPPAPVATPPPATPEPYDAMAELKKQLAPLAQGAGPTAQARLLYARAELLKLIKKEPEAAALYGEIAEKFKPEQLSAPLLALVGDYLQAHGKPGEAEKRYQNLKVDYPKSDFLDFAYVGLGEIALGRQQYANALKLFTYAADEIAGIKIKDATMGKARAQMELTDYASAKKGFEQIASIREWRGESTAMALYFLGEVERRQGHWAEAIAHYQRVFVAYQKFLPWVAKAYLASAQCFEKLGQRPEAVGHLREMMRNEKLVSFPEAKEAADLLQKWGGSA